MGKVKDDSKAAVPSVPQMPEPTGQSKAESKFIVPKGQLKLTEEELDREEDIEYSEPNETEITVQRYFNVRKQKICKQRPTFQVLLDLSPSVVFEHKAAPTRSDPEIPVTYFREKQKVTALGDEMMGEDKKEEGEDDERRNNQDDDSDAAEEEEEWVDSSSDSDVAVDKASEVEEEEAAADEEVEEEEMEVGEEELIDDVDRSFVSEMGTRTEVSSRGEGSAVSEMEAATSMDVFDMEEEENENLLSPHPSWAKLPPLKQEKSIFNFREDATHMSVKPMDTYYAIQTDVPDIIHVGGRFCMASTYDAYVTFEKKVRNASGKIASVMEELERMLEEGAKDKAQDALEIDFETIKIGRHDRGDESGGDSGDDRYPDDDYLIDDIMSNYDVLDIESGGDLSSSSEDEEEEQGAGKDKDSERGDEKVKEVKKVEEDIDGYDLLPDDFDSEQKSDKNQSPSAVTMLDEKKSKGSKKKEVTLKVVLTTAQKEQILNHILNPLEYDAVVLKKDEGRDVDFDGPASDDDPTDSGEYLLAKYGTDARGLISESNLDVGKADKKGAEQEKVGEKEFDAEPAGNLINIQHLQKILEKYKYLEDLKKSGGVIIEKQYKKFRGITKAMCEKVENLLSEKNQISGTNTQLKQLRLKRKLKLKRQVRDGYKFALKTSCERLPKQRRVTVPHHPYSKEKRAYNNYYLEEYKRLVIANRLIHQKQFINIGWDFLEFEDNDDNERSLYPLKKLPFLGSKDLRITHMSWAHHLKHNLAISYESEFCGAEHEGYVVFYHPMANSGDYDHVYKFSSGVRHFDIAFEWLNNGLMLVALEDGSIQMVKIPFPNVIQSTSPRTKHSSAVLQVMWLPDWHGKETLDAKKQPTPNVRFQRFLSYAADGELKFWLRRPYVGFSVYKTVHMDVVSLPSDLVTRYKRITCVGSDYHDRTVLYIGCEDGQVYKYDTRYPANIFVCVLNAHRGAVTDIAVNHFNRDVFLSGGVDGWVKLWRGNTSTPVWGYWLANPPASIKWSHLTAYVWTVVTRDNFVHMYNIEQHFHKPLTSQQVMEYSSCVKVEFHQVYPLLMIADNLCNVFAFKISLMTTEPEVMEEDEDANQPEEDEEDVFTQQRKRLRRVLDKHEILVRSCTRINTGDAIEKLAKEAIGDSHNDDGIIEKLAKEAKGDSHNTDGIIEKLAKEAMGD